MAVFAEANYEDLELWYPLLRLREAGAEAFVVGTGSSTSYMSKHGYPVKVDAEAETVCARPVRCHHGSWWLGSRRLRRYPAVLKLVKEADEQGKVIGAICHGARC